MPAILIVAILSILSFLIEALLFQIFGRMFLPNLSLILVLFLSFSLGIRYSLFAALLTGLLKDSLGGEFFGLHMLSFVACAFAATFLQKYIYQRGSRGSRLVFMMVLITIDFVIHFVFNLTIQDFNFFRSLFYVYLPEMAMTLLVTNFVFDKLKLCVLKFFV